MVDHRRKQGKKLAPIHDVVPPTSIVAITKFDGDFAFLSNFYPAEIGYGIVFPSVEHFFQAMKTVDHMERATIAIAETAGIAKKLGRQVKLRPDWEAIKNNVMMLGLRKKFSHDVLGQMLTATRPCPLVEGNWWHDNYWGDCKCPQCSSIAGTNMLGKLLMSIREDLLAGRPAYIEGNDPQF